MAKLCFILCVGILFCQCSSHKIPPDVLSINQMKTIIWDLLKAGEVGARDTIHNKTVKFQDQETTLYQAVFQLHHTDKASFYKSYNFYLQNPKWNSILMDSLNALANRERNSIYTYHPPIRTGNRPNLPLNRAHPLNKLHEKQTFPKR